MPDMPVIIRKPKLLLQELDPVTGEPTVDPPVDVSCDVTAVEIVAEQDIERVTTFCGSFPVIGEVESTATLSVAVGVDTSANWLPFVGVPLEMHVYDRFDSTKYRKFRTELSFDPSLYGPTNAEEQVRAYDFDVPVYEGPEWVSVV